MPSRSRKLGGSAAGGLRYYGREKDLELGLDATLGYYDAKVGEGKVFATAWGNLAEEWGIAEGVTRAQFEQLWAGKWDAEGVKMLEGRFLKNKETGEREWVPRTPGFDVLYTSPKSVMELIIKAPPEMRPQIIEAWTESVKVSVLRGVEAEARLARVPVGAASGKTKQQGSRTERVPGDIIAIPVVQYSARPTEQTVERGSPSDPHLHCHVLIFSIVRAPDGRIITADEYGLKAREWMNPELRDQLVQGEFARRLEDLGARLRYTDFDLSRNGRVSWEWASSDAKLRKFWSTNGERAWEIRREYEDRYGHPMSDQTLNDVLTNTRHTKSDKEMDSRPVFERWAEDAMSHGFAMPGTEFSSGARRDLDRSLQELTRRVTSANGLHRDGDVFGAPMIRPTVARCAVGLGFTPDELDTYIDTLMLGPEMIRVRKAERPDAEYFVTKTLVEAELRIEALLEEADVVNITGYAGTGKSTLAADAVCLLRGRPGRPGVKLDAEQKAGVKAIAEGFVKHAGLAAAADQIVVASTAGRTALETGAKLKADRAGSIDSILNQIARGKLIPTAQTVVFVEEAAAVGTFKMDQLLQAVGPAYVVLVGDSAQLPSIGAGGWYGDQLARHGSKELVNVRRQKNPDDVRDFNLIRNGRAPEALANLAERGRVRVSAEPSTKWGEVQLDYAGFRRAGWQARNIRIIVDTSNADVDAANRFVQRDRMERGELRGSGVEIQEPDQDRRWRVYEGDQVVFRAAYARRGQEPIKNGMAAEVLSLNEQTGRMRVKIGDRIATVDSGPWVQPGYAVHTHKQQGGEVEIVQYLPGMGQTTANSAYSSTTRAINECHVYLDRESHTDNPIEAVGKAWQVPDEKRSALFHLRQETADPQSVAQQQFVDPGLRVKAASYAEIISQQAGEELASRVVASPSFRPLVQTMHDLEREGTDALEMLSKAVADRELVTAEDPAAVIRWRMERTPERSAQNFETHPVDEARLDRLHQHLGSALDRSGTLRDSGERALQQGRRGRRSRARTGRSLGW